jgi:hypothetical protein
MPYRPPQLALLTLVAAAALTGFFRADGDFQLSPGDEPAGVTAQTAIGRPAPPPPGSTLSEERAGQDRTELRQPGWKAGCAPAARALDGFVAPWSTIRIAPPHILPRSRLHLLLCTWLI